MKQYNYLFRVPNNEEGELFRSLMKKFLNKNTFRLVRRGRDDKPMKDAPWHRYNVHVKDSKTKELHLVSPWVWDTLRRYSKSHSNLQKPVTRKVVKELMRVCIEDDNFADLAARFEALYLSKILLGEE